MLAYTFFIEFSLSENEFLNPFSSNLFTFLSLLRNFFSILFPKHCPDKSIKKRSGQKGQLNLFLQMKRILFIGLSVRLEIISEIYDFSHQ